MDLTPSQLEIEQVAKQQAQASLEGLNLNWSDWSVLFYLFILFLMTRSQKHQQRKTGWSFINETWANLPCCPIYLKLFIWTHSLSFPSSMKALQLQHLRTTECVFQCNEDLRRSEGLGLRCRPHCRCNFTPEACLVQNENSLSKWHSLVQRYDHTDGN